MNRDPVVFKWTTVPANNQVVVPLDSTRWPSGPTASTSIATNSPLLAPGLDRGFLAGCIVRFSVLCTGQNVTVLEQILTGNAGTSADWETQGASGTIAVVAGTTQPLEWKPATPDFRLRIDAGATGPTTLVLQIELVWGEDFGT